MKLEQNEFNEFKKIILATSEENEYVSIALRDLFAVGCYMISIGEIKVGNKICYTALLAIGFKENLLSKLMDEANNPESGGELIRIFMPHKEVEELLK